MEDNVNSVSSDSSDKIIVSCPAVVAACEAFADKRMTGSADLYRSRGELKLDKIRQDIVTGALAEFAVYEYFSNKGVECSKPDLEIYENKKKTYSPDLVAGGCVLHVKSQTVASAAKYGSSWLFQSTDKLLGTPSETALMIFCLVDGHRVEIKAIVSVLDIVENGLTAKPKVWRYANSKVAIYLKSVLESNINLWRL